MSFASLARPFLGPVSAATIVFPLLAALSFLPFALFHYRKHGHIHPLRALVTYAFGYYLIAAACLVILPLPSLPGSGSRAEWDAVYGEFRTPRLDPAGWLRAIIDIHAGPTRTKAIFNSLANGLILLPFGFFLRWLLQRRVLEILLAGFMLSLAFELCQLTGDFWIFPGPYRLFDTGDLLLNTAGALAGGFLAALLARLRALPGLDSLAGPPGPWIGPVRRALALLVDLFAMCATAAVAWLAGILAMGGRLPERAVVAGGAAIVLLWMVLLPALDRGRSLGKRLTLCAVMEAKGRPAGAWRLLARQALLWGPPCASALGFAFAPGPGFLSWPSLAVLGAWLALLLADSLRAAFTAEHAGALDLWLGLRVRNTWADEGRAAATKGTRPPRASPDSRKSRPRKS